MPKLTRKNLFPLNFSNILYYFYKHKFQILNRITSVSLRNRLSGELTVLSVHKVRKTLNYCPPETERSIEVLTFNVCTNFHRTTSRGRAVKLFLVFLFH